MKCVFHALHWMKYFTLYPRFNINVNCFLKLSYKNKWKKARIHCEIFLSDCFMKHSLMNISIVYKKTDEWYIELQRVTTNDNEWQQVVQRVTISANFSFFQIREEPTTKHPTENSLNIETDLWRRPIELRAETNP